MVAINVGEKNVLASKKMNESNVHMLVRLTPFYLAETKCEYCNGEYDFSWNRDDNNNNNKKKKLI